MSNGCIKASLASQLVETVAYVITVIPFLDSDSSYFFIKNDLKLLKERVLEMITKCRRAESQSWP